ncbi:hypothetical protein EHQ68_01845 [Leptospira congkakensis]|uniref:SH3b domain-containing protein n=1 Tax=Leptospira congkakensis TaxID=2484932 RepID=A0A4Z1AGJ7_9LEPT|nr:hypothetical protein [Leptospira congkakensis]TGL90200.1 hypothetical protein EHQ69_09610 [Leptospira congkakensis]TGL91206.1 hypothetical protein EHQ68_01845 [Leptospira congkakensis]TGL98258.1 hypothetical protein EHQ70_01435 [Leptospira congkakensis]
MIRSRVFLAFGLLFSLIVIITYAFVDFREREDKAYDLYQSEAYLKVLKLYSDTEIPSSELELTILSQTISQLEKKLNEKGSPKDLISFFKKRSLTKLIEWETTRGTYYHIEDPYLSHLKKHGDGYKRALITKIGSLSKPIPKREVTHLLLLLILEDPRGMEESFSRSLANLLSFPFEPIGEIESEFLLQSLHFLANTQNTVLFHQTAVVRGKNVNLRSGPGRENAEVGKISEPELTFCLEEDSGSETIAGKVGHWKRCYFPNLQKSTWIFSGFLTAVSPNTSYIGDFEKRFKSVDNEIRIDFEGWNGNQIPATFFGEYISRESVRVSGETGFPIYGKAKNSKGTQRICKKLSGDKNYFEFSFSPTDSEVPITFLELHLNYDNREHLAYSISLDQESIWINKNRYVLDGEKRRENLSLHIESREGDKWNASLWRRNTGLIQSIRSLSLDESVLQSGRYSWEICLPLTKEPNREQVLLFEIRTGIH